MKKRLLCIILAAGLLIPSVPVLAEENVVANESVETEERPSRLDAPAFASWDISNGDIAWGVTENEVGSYELIFYREGEAEHFYEIRWRLYDWEKEQFVTEISTGLLAQMNSGSYYFTVCAKGNEEIADSEVCTSNVFSYEKPDKAKAVPTELKWNKEIVTWSSATDGSVAYELECCKDGEQEFVKVASEQYARTDSVTEIDLIDKMKEKGTYRFRIKSISSNIFEEADSEWSEWCYSLSADEWPFTDVAQSGWKYDGIKYVYDNKIMNGVGDGTLFDPDASLTREMFATVLWRMAGAPTVAFEAKFSDVPPEKWYSHAVIWAYQQGIISGLDGGTRFGTGESITREQIAKMLMEYAKMRGYSTEENVDLNDFTDRETVSKWAVEYMQWAVGCGMINGSKKDGEYYLNPRGLATRAECATMLSRFAPKYR